MKWNKRNDVAQSLQSFIFLFSPFFPVMFGSACLALAILIISIIIIVDGDAEDDGSHPGRTSCLLYTSIDFNVQPIDTQARNGDEN